VLSIRIMLENVKQIEQFPLHELQRNARDTRQLYANNPSFHNAGTTSAGFRSRIGNAIRTKECVSSVQF